METSLTIAVVGLGLIGGSFCRSIRAKTTHTCIGIDTDAAVTRAALDADAIHTAGDAEALRSADMVIICLHPDQTLRFIEAHADKCKPGSIVFDACGVKTEIVQAAVQAAFAPGVHFIGAHPMAGREFSGFAYSLPTLFEGASFICTPPHDTPAERIDALRAFAHSLGFTRFVVTTPEEHDRIIAYTSQLAHIVSNAYVKSPTLSRELGFSAGSFQDLTRVAKLDEDLWTDLFMKNRAPLLRELQTLRAQLDAYANALEADDAQAMRLLLRAGRLRKEECMDRRHIQDASQ